MSDMEQDFLKEVLNGVKLAVCVKILFQLYD